VGGGIYNHGATLYISNCVITGNQVSGTIFEIYGGGVFSVNSTTIDNSSISNNQVVSSHADTNVYGGGIAGRGPITITNSTIFGNQLVPASSGVSANGGGIYVSDADLTVSNSTIEQNSAQKGGGIYLRENYRTIITNSQIHDNDATQFGAGVYSNYSMLSISNSTISDNEASGGGGFFPNFTYDTTITDSTFAGNKSTVFDGGGIANVGGEIDISGCTFANNTSFSNGGAIFNQDTMTVTNSTLSGNYAGMSGGGLSTHDSQTNLRYVTITDNTADDSWDGNGDGGGIYADSESSVYLMSSIVAKNYDSSPQSYDLHHDCSGNIISQEYNLIGKTTGCNLTGANLHNLIDPNPRLKDLGDNGGPTETHALQSDSPAIDQVPAGVNGCGSPPFDVDQRGILRAQGTGCEMGAYETSARLVIHKDVTPETDISFHSEVTYTILLVNGGDLSATEVSLTDTLPDGVTFDRWINHPTGVEVSNDVITWQGDIGVMGSVELSFVATHTGSFGDQITNMVHFSHVSGSGSDTVTFSVESGYSIYLPLVLRGQE
jgi:uncharacterized repeat protein (TIGR01451 family)